MPNPPQPWYTPGQPQQPVPGNPYAAEGGEPQGYGPPPGPGYGPPPGPPPRRGRFGRAPVVAAVVALVLVVVAGGVYAVTDWGRDAPAKPVAKESPRPSGEASPSRTPAARAPEPRRIPTTEEINASRKPADATAWIVDDKTDLPNGIHRLHDLWVVGDTVVQALHRKVAAYRLSDGAEVWSLPLPAAVCETPANPTPDGRVVLFYRESAQAARSNRCNQMLSLDLKTGKQGWHKVLGDAGDQGSTLIVHSAISGDTLAIAWGIRAAAFRVDDGTKLYDIPRENPGQCYPDDVAGGTRLLVSSLCALSAGRSKSYSQLREIDPRSGKVLWRHRTKAGWKFGSLISVDPVVFTTENAEDIIKDWRVLVLGSKGKLRTTIDPREKGFEQCAGDGSGGDIQPCRGSTVGKGLVMLGGTDRVGTYDLDTGKFLWGVKSEQVRKLYPLRAESDKEILVYESATSTLPGRTFLLGPGGAGTEKTVLQHPAAAAPFEFEMFGGRLAYVDGRLVVTHVVVTGNDARPEARMLSFAPAPS
ncbi:PQQ-binding-like beta-propeller repeat protein [Streptomyces sp. C11-1]|uniref:PQQ-binding-like beta-propeller repeat protein n=1 Tax=Streptomyces durocortorensis TaxID=2811104 RepID=A0ABY9VYN6_9ACTN|nr:PQQ-binding-like beta-propeller repeat protein [Streptomyces durocortorensis]WNF29007.1 PQQ-binding-like beta-propeller repeat protein [Streptomyces durocortorensis]